MSALRQERTFGHNEAWDRRHVLYASKGGALIRRIERPHAGEGAHGACKSLHERRDYLPANFLD